MCWDKPVIKSRAKRIDLNLEYWSIKYLEPHKASGLGTNSITRECKAGYDTTAMCWTLISERGPHDAHATQTSTYQAIDLHRTKSLQKHTS